MAKKYIPKQFSPRIYAEWGELYSDLTDNQMAELLKAITKFPNYDIKNVPVWGFIKSQLQKDYDSFIATCNENASKINNYWGEQRLTVVNRSKPKLNRGKPKQEQEQEHITETKKETIIVNKLKNILSVKYNKKFETKNWDKDISLLIEKDLVSFERIDKALDWYSQKIGGDYIPVIQSAKSLREKFIKLESAMSRKNLNNKKPQGSYNNYSESYGEDIPL